MIYETYVNRPVTGKEHSTRRHVPRAQNSLAGTELSNFIQGERVLGGDFYVLQVAA
ncbi:hypothetical protein ACFV0O_00255 [Kitasatospora sp. NPDC059577]|uniref:hypothetical protein n=1 Tax=Kitasatospora sp. NPDC059577 TaxID=3346873 RepID=UPI0036CC3C29